MGGDAHSVTVTDTDREAWRGGQRANVSPTRSIAVHSVSVSD